METQRPQETLDETPWGWPGKESRKMDAFGIASEVIDLRSFSNLWFWIALAVLWSSASHWVMGVPHDMIYRARRLGGQAEKDVQDLARVYATRILDVIDTGLPLVIGFACFWFTVLGTLAFVYDVEFAQALFLMMGPMTIVIWHSIRTARIVIGSEGAAETLFQSLLWHRRVTQLVGMIAITVTAIYGMWQNFHSTVLN